MKTLKKVEIELILIDENEYLPNEMKFGKFYYSKELKGSNHLCLCGCGHECYLPITNNGWSVLENVNSFSLTPSIQQRFDCKSHYIITNNVANFV